MANQIGVMMNKIGDLKFPEFSADERTLLSESLASLKEALEAAMSRVAKSAGVGRRAKSPVIAARAAKSKKKAT